LAERAAAVWWTSKTFVRGTAQALRHAEIGRRVMPKNEPSYAKLTLTQYAAM